MSLSLNSDARGTEGDRLFRSTLKQSTQATANLEEYESPDSRATALTVGIRHHRSAPRNLVTYA